MGQPDLLLTLAGALGAALVLGYSAHRLGLSPIVGYLLAGIALGPASPGFDADREMALQLAEIGIVLLMFGVGLQLHVRELFAVRRLVIPGAIVQTLVATALGAAVLVWAGGTWKAAVVYGFALSMASSVVLVRMLSDTDQLHTATGRIAIGWEVLKDLFTVVALVLIPSFFASSEGSGSGSLSDIGVALLKIIGLLLLAALVGSRLIPWLMAKVALTRSRELFTLTILVLALGIAIGSARAFGVSIALGALLAGLVVGRSEFSFRAASEALPMRDAFAVLFFVSVGMLFDPASVFESPGLLALTLAVIMIGKPLVALGVSTLLGYPSRIGLGLAMALSQVGEFSFILATLGAQLGFLSTDATNAIIAAAIISISANSVIHRTVDPLNRGLSRHPAIWRLLNRARSPRGSGGEVEEAQSALLYRAVIVGHGPVGRTLARLLREQGIDVCIIEMNLTTVQLLKKEGVRACYGDATLRPILVEAGVATAGALLLTVSGFHHADEVINLARELNPGIHIVARAAYLADIPTLRSAGADRVFSGEGEVALGMTEYVLSELGATPEQIDRERARVHGELF